MDSGASEHVLCERAYLREIKVVATISVELAKMTKLMYTVKRKIDADTGKVGMTVTTEYFIPGTKQNTISCSELDKRGVLT